MVLLRLLVMAPPVLGDMKEEGRVVYYVRNVVIWSGKMMKEIKKKPTNLLWGLVSDKQ